MRGKQHIIEIGAVKWLPNDQVEFFSELIQPYKFKKLNASIQKLTGIKTEDLLFAPTFKQVIKRFIKWSQGNTIFVTFGEFDRKIMEEELFRNRIQRRFLYPIVDFQQKYMIENQLIAQPSLNRLMETFNVYTEREHRALQDANALFQIFKAADGPAMIERQKTNQFALLLSENHHKDEEVEVFMTYVAGEVFPSNIRIHSIHSIHKTLACIKKVQEVVGEDGGIIRKEIHEILPDEELAHFLRKVEKNVKNKVLITRSGLKPISRLYRLHHCSLPKTEVMTLQNLLMDEKAVNRFTMNGQPLDAYEKNICQLLFRYKNKLIEEFNKRNLLLLREAAKVSFY